LHGLACWRVMQIVAIQNHQIGSNPTSDGSGHILDCLHTHGGDARFAQFGPNRAAQVPFTGDDEDDRHTPSIREIAPKDCRWI